ncbi:solute carrier family 52, riboflavin transporter, member 3 [Sceloporus undulatus]|uniref:solute carrier family 52, riboflavin transporter, member 3 n=1 Tax=Sceloporus undulatus TaxID=8520 RepID=UPI001C4AAF5C|nr:solute carrier family 52, riboflavin transporter, member 3 [Sceloporus undulatus]
MALLTHVLACVFGTGSWMAINGVWVELPLLVNKLPEGWYLPSYLIIIIQLANIGPLFITLMHKLKPGMLSEVPVICVVVSAGAVACFLLAFFWDYITPVAGRMHSTPFFILAFFLSLVDCTSSVTFLPFMARLHPRYVTTFFIGEGLSGLIPALFALAQGAGIAKCVQVEAPENATVSNTTLRNMTAEDVHHHMATRYSPANFSSMVFFIILSVMMFSCLVAFFFLNRLPKVWELSKENLCASDITLNAIHKIPVDGQGPTNVGCFSTIDAKVPSTTKGKDDKDPGTAAYSQTKFIFIYLLVAWVNSLTNGVLPSVQSYSCLPYSSMAYHLAATLSSIANPLACTVATFLPSRSLPVLGVLTATGTAFGAYNMGMAALSPCPVLQHSTWGDVLIVISWVFFTGTLTYVKVMMGVILRSHSHSALVWYGAVEQLGSLLGALTMFPLVNIYSLFKSADFCSFQCPA